MDIFNIRYTGKFTFWEWIVHLFHFPQMFWVTVTTPCFVEFIKTESGKVEFEIIMIDDEGNPIVKRGK